MVNNPPELTTTRLRLRPLTEHDVDRLVPIYTNPEVTHFYRDPITDRPGVQLMVDRRLLRPLDPGMGSWVLERAGQVVGLSHLVPSTELPAGVPEMGWLLGRDFWGQGLATEAATVVRDYALYRLGLPAVWALIHRENKPSRALAQRLGFLDVGEGEHYGARHRVNVALPVRSGAVHHIELWVASLPMAEAALGWLLTELGWRPGERWSNGMSWHRGSGYLVIEDSPDRVGDRHDRLRPGLNHLALHAGSTARVDELTSAAVGRGWRLLFADRHPHAGGAHQHAAYLESPDGFELELVAEPERPATN